jgi:hypothetical protein
MSSGAVHNIEKDPTIIRFILEEPPPIDGKHVNTVSRLHQLRDDTNLIVHGHADTDAPPLDRMSEEDLYSRRDSPEEADRCLEVLFEALFMLLSYLFLHCHNGNLRLLALQKLSPGQRVHFQNRRERLRIFLRYDVLVLPAPLQPHDQTQLLFFAVKDWQPSGSFPIVP